MRALSLMTLIAWLGAAVAHAQEPMSEPTTEPTAPPAPAAEVPTEAGTPAPYTPIDAPPQTKAVEEAGAAPSAQTQPAQPGSAATEANANATTSSPHYHSVPQIGIAPGTAQTGTLELAAPPPPTMTNVPTEGEWRFDFHGFLRAPLRLSLGSGSGFANADQGDKWHSPPQIPDGTFTSWAYTNNAPGPWAELHFSYGNTRVTGHVLVAAYEMTDGGYRDLQAQLGINQAFVTLNEGDLLGDRGGLLWNVGVFQNRYGAAGRYDAGFYETYLFGRTHVMGETLTGFYNFSNDWQLTVEHGFGVKLEVPPQVDILTPTPAYLPYPGPVQQGTELVHHAHIALTYDEHVTLTGHYITTWTDDARLPSEVDGRITVTGADLRMIDTRFGDGYIGWSHVASHNPLRVGEGLELLHSTAGWNLRNNFFGPDATGSGTLDNVLLQYTFSFARFLRYPEAFWGQGPDIAVSIFGLYDHVKSTDAMFVSEKIATNKLKYGADAVYTPLSFLGIGMRVDRVQPDMANNTLAFSQISPKLIVRSTFVTHEQIVLQYTRYFNGSHVVADYPTLGYRADKDMFMIAASMWW